MKKLKKFAALLLVGVMALALLTACGGGGSGENAQAEASVMTAINGKRTAAAKLDNDAERKAVASQNIDYVVKHGFGSFSSGALMAIWGWEAVNLAMVPALTVAAIALIWLLLDRAAFLELENWQASALSLPLREPTEASRKNR